MALHIAAPRTAAARTAAPVDHNAAGTVVHIHLERPAGMRRRTVGSFAARSLDMLGSDLHTAGSLDALSSPDAHIAGLFHFADYAGIIISLYPSP